MFKSKGKAGGGSGKSKSRGKKITKKSYRQLETPPEHIVKLREALFESDGTTDKDVFATLKPFLAFKKNGLDLTFTFMSGAEFKKQRTLTEYAFKTAKKNLETLYDASGYGWDDFERKSEMCDPCCRFIFVYDKDHDLPLGFAAFVFTMQGSLVGQMTGQPCVLLNDLHLDPSIQRKGVGTALIKLLTLVAVREKMSYVMIKTISGCTAAENLMTSRFTKFNVDDGAYECLDSDEFDEHADAFVVYSRCVDKKIIKANEDKENVQALARDLAKKLSAGK